MISTLLYIYIFIFLVGFGSLKQQISFREKYFSINRFHLCLVNKSDTEKRGRTNYSMLRTLCVKKYMHTPVHTFKNFCVLRLYFMVMVRLLVTVKGNVNAKHTVISAL